MVQKLQATQVTRLENGDRVVLFVEDIKRYVSRIDRGKGQNPLEAAKEGVDSSCILQVEVIERKPDKVAFFTVEDNKQYVSRIDRGGHQYIEAAKSSRDGSCEFTVLWTNSGKLTLYADNERFVSRIEEGGREPLEAVKTSPDAFSQFIVYKPEK